jgi:hypothetical protein
VDDVAKNEKVSKFKNISENTNIFSILFYFWNARDILQFAFAIPNNFLCCWTCFFLPKLRLKAILTIPSFTRGKKQNVVCRQMWQGGLAHRHTCLAGCLSLLLPGQIQTDRSNNDPLSVDVNQLSAGCVCNVNTYQ